MRVHELAAVDGARVPEQVGDGLLLGGLLTLVLLPIHREQMDLSIHGPAGQQPVILRLHVDRQDPGPRSLDPLDRLRLHDVPDKDDTVLVRGGQPRHVFFVAPAEGGDVFLVADEGGLGGDLDVAGSLVFRVVFIQQIRGLLARLRLLFLFRIF